MRVGKSPLIANSPVQPFRAGFGRLCCQRLNGVRFEEFAGPLPTIGYLAKSISGGDRKQRDMVAQPAVA